MIERSFQLSKGVGPWREKDLWARGIANWDDFEKAAAREVVMSKRLDAETLQQIAKARAALEAGDLPTLASLIPVREQWRLYPGFESQAAFLDLEADDDLNITVGGIYDRDGPATFIAGVSLGQMAERLSRSPIWVSFNGSVFDVPVMRRHFPDLVEPAAHIDLRFLSRRARLKGGLKLVEDTLGLGRPPHLRGVRGLDAIRLWREYTINKEIEGLRLLVEYNLYDAINLKSVLEHSINRVADQADWPRPYERPFERGETLYDLSQLLLNLKPFWSVGQ